MITLHHLAYSRSLRVLWLLEELGVEYKLVSYERTKDLRAPPELAKVHPLGKAPVIVDGDLVLAESSAILRYIYGRNGNGELTPPKGTDAYALHDEWLDYVESSAGMPIMMSSLGSQIGGLSDGIKAFVVPELAKTLGYIASGLGDNTFLMGKTLTLADIQMSYMLAIASNAGVLKDYPSIGAYFERLNQQPGFQRATARGGPMIPSRPSSN